MRQYRVRDGDYFTQLADRYGFDAEATWNHPRNEGLRKLRGDPEILAPGDLVYIPAADHRRFHLAPGGVHRFRGRRTRVEVQVALTTEHGPLANEPFELEGAGLPTTGQTDANGLLRAEVAVDVRTLRVHLTRRGQTLEIMVGHLDPVSERSGQRQRLEHLGYLEHGVAPTRADGVIARTRMRAALVAFQEAHGLAVTGAADAATQTKLVDVHGS